MLILLLGMCEVQSELVTEYINFQNENKFSTQYFAKFHFNVCVDFHTLVEGMT